MRGRGHAYGAVSIVNAISTGRGAALGIDLVTKAEVKLDHSSLGVRLLNRGRGPSLAREVVKAVTTALGMEEVGAEVRTESNIPEAVGLKSSSSAAVAIALATLDALGTDMQDTQLLRLVAEASLSSGTSITGALDDASACMLGGFTVTDNTGMKLLKREEAGENLRVAVLIPPRKTYTSEFRREDLNPISELVSEAFNLALKGEYWKAMTLNGLLHAAALSIDTKPIIEALRRGALAAGVSGTGPAVAAVTTADRVDDVRDVLAEYDGYVITSSVNNRRGGFGWP